MNKNQKNIPYTFNKLILGRWAAVTILNQNIEKIEKQIKSEKRRAQKENRRPEIGDMEYRIRVFKAEIEEHNQQAAHFSLCYSACGDETVLVR